MSIVLFLSAPAHGNVNPTLGLVSELVKQGERIIYFSSNEFKEKIEETGATFKCYAEDLDIFKQAGSLVKGTNGTVSPMHRVLASADKIIADILNQIEGIKIDYMIHSFAFMFTKGIAHVLQVPRVSSLAIFAGLKDFESKANMPVEKLMPGNEEMINTYREVSARIQETYGIPMPDNFLQLMFNKGDINLVYTSKYFAPDTEDFDDSYKFVGPPIYTRKENLDFPFEKLQGKRVIYISLGTVFSNYSTDIYNLFFDGFRRMDAVIVMAAYKVDLASFAIPDNFIVRNYVPQSALLPYVSAAVTHAGMNSMSDFISANIPFVAIPLGADQPLLAKRAQELGAAISLDIKSLTPELVRHAVEEVLTEPSYRENIGKINESFIAAGGYKKAVEEIFMMKAEKGIK